MFGARFLFLWIGTDVMRNSFSRYLIYRRFGSANEPVCHPFCGVDKARGHNLKQSPTRLSAASRFSKNRLPLECDGLQILIGVGWST